MIEIKDCYKKYSDKLIFENVSYKFENKIYWLKANNGVGKSVFLRCLTNVEKFTGGTLEGNNNNKILYIPEFALNEDWLTLKENIELLMFYHKLNVEEEELRNILLKLNIDSSDILPNKASLGTNIKTGLALIFIKNYWDLIIIDESLAHIDKKTLNNIIEELKKRCDENATVIFTHHSDLENETVKSCIKDINLEIGGIY